MMTTRTRKVYLQCESELSNEQQENIRNCSDSIMNIEFPAGQLIQSRGNTQTFEVESPVIIVVEHNYYVLRIFNNPHGDPYTQMFTHPPSIVL